MKIAIPVTNNIENPDLSLRFGRSPFFAIISDNQKQQQIVENPFYDQKKGIANALKQLLIDKYDIGMFIAYELGLKIQEIAGKNNIQLVIINTKNKTLNEIKELLVQNQPYNLK